LLYVHLLPGIQHDHPHNDALEIYGEYFNEDSIFHLGKNRECIIVDIRKDGNIDVKLDKELVEEYGIEDNGKDGKNQQPTEKKPPRVVISDSPRKAWCV